MADQFPSIDSRLQAFIEAQPLFFTGTAAPDGRVNISPKGMESLRVLGPNRILWRNATGSGNETAAHMLADGRLTIMFCAFEGPAMILRLYGRGRIAARGSDEYARYLASAFDGNEPAGARQIVIQEIDLVQTSCGYGVPLHDYKQERPTLVRWAEAKGEAGIADYWREKNRVSLDGLSTGMD